MLSIYDLAYERAQQVSPCSPATKRQILDEIRGRLLEGWTDRDIQLGTCRENDNLLDPYRFYYHSQLHIAPPPPRLVMDLESGECHSTSEPWFLEMKASYTPRDLMTYYRHRIGLEGSAERATGAIKWITGRYDIEHLLFMVDAMRADIDGGCQPPTSPLQLREYERQAREAMEQKQSEMTELGVNRVVPRERRPLPLR